MRPRIDAVFATFAMDLAQRVIPAISPSYHQGTIGMIASMLAMVAEEWDRGASRRIEENSRIRDLFRDSAASVKDAGLKRRLSELAETSDRDFRISALEANNCTLRAALIDLHAHVEQPTGPEARKVEEAIWRELLQSTERRRLSTAQF